MNPNPEVRIQELVLPEPISLERRSHLINEKKISPVVAAIDLSMVKLKLQDSDEGLGWTSAQCEVAEVEYKRFLHLCMIHGKGIVPNKIMDQMWHYHILDTRAYHKDCDEVFGHYMHHFPYFGMRGDQDAKNLESEFRVTQKRYMEAFREDMSRGEATDCWHDCQGRCHNACSNK